MKFAEFDYVRIARLLRDADEYDDFEDNDHAPKIGEEGIVMDVDLRGDGLIIYTVEGRAADGATLWVAAFEEEELAAIGAGAESAQVIGERAVAGAPRELLIGGSVALFALLAVLAWIWFR